MPRIKLVVDTGFANCEHIDFIDVPDEEWKSLTPDEQDECVQQDLRDHLYNHVETYWELAEEGEG